MIAQDTAFETSESGPGPEIGIKDGRPIQFVLVGRLTYRDLSGLTHHTGFALEVAPMMPAFVPHANSAYDYHD
jgi:hypothetical protein